MDMMQIRRGLLAQMASGAKVKTGSFVGSNNIDQTIDIGFEPDIIIVNCSNLNGETAGWLGQKNIVIIKNMVAYQLRHNSDTQTSPSVSGTDNLGGQYPAYGETDGYYRPYGVYEDGLFTISNGTRNAINKFVDNETYEWIAIKF